MKIYFNYKLSNDLHNVRNLKNPADVFWTIAKFYTRLGIVNMVTWIVPEAKLKTFSFLDWNMLQNADQVEVKNGEKFVKDTDFPAEVTDERLGYLEIDTSKLQAIWKSVDDVKIYLEKIWVNFSVYTMTQAETVAWIKFFTTIQEVETNKFEIYPASEFDWEINEAKYIIIE